MPSHIFSSDFPNGCPQRCLVAYVFCKFFCSNKLLVDFFRTIRKCCIFSYVFMTSTHCSLSSEVTFHLSPPFSIIFYTCIAPYPSKLSSDVISSEKLFNSAFSVKPGLNVHHAVILIQNYLLLHVYSFINLSPNW